MTRDATFLILEVLGIAAVTAGFLWLLIRRNQPSLESLRKQQAQDLELETARLEIQTRKRLDEEFERLKLEHSKALQTLSERENAVVQREIELTERANHLDGRFTESEIRESELSEMLALRQGELQRISKLTPEAAKDLILKESAELYQEVAQAEGRALAKDIQDQALALARRTMITAMERCASDFVTEATTAVVMLPTEDMKGRLIGREGRNIRAFEQVTGVDLIIDDTPEAVVLSCFDPVRRETARLTLMNLMLDGRIHPGRIEELFELSKLEVERTIRDAGDRAAEEAAVPPLPHKVIEMMGRLRFRTSMGQNVLDHSVEVSRLAGMLASDLGLNALVAKQAGFLHDIGKALPSDWEGPHALIGMEFLRQCELGEVILNAVGAHHREIEPATAEAEIVIVADTLSAARPGARRDNLDHFVKRMAELESIAASLPGVDRVYAVQAGRELRVVVLPEAVSDLAAQALTRTIVQKIENELQYPGVIKVTVIRESRYSEVAK